ncbi:DUF732 domain-containing protein [Nocardia fluminea]
MNRPPSITLAIFGASAVLLLGACTSASETTPTAQQRVFPATAQATTTTSAADSLDQIYLRVLAREGITELHNSGVDLVSFGREVVCATFAEEGRPTPAFAAGAALGVADHFDSFEDSAYAIGAAVASYCPQFNYLFEE